MDIEWTLRDNSASVDRRTSAASLPCPGRLQAFDHLRLINSSQPYWTEMFRYCLYLGPIRSSLSGLNVSCVHLDQGVRSVIRSNGDDLRAPFWRDIVKSVLPLHRAVSGLHFHGNDRLLISTIEALSALGADVNATDHAGKQR